MNNRPKPVKIRLPLILFAGFFLFLGLEILLSKQPAGWRYWSLAVLLAGGVAWLLTDWYAQRHHQQRLHTSLQENQRVENELELRLKGMLRLNQVWLEAQTEKDLIERSLSIFGEITGAVGVSFMPFDEWGQPLNALTYGAYPSPVLKAWAEHLSEPRVRNRCRVCQRLETTVGESCPLLEAPFDQSVRIYCLPLQRENQTLAMLNLYLPPDRQLNENTHEFLTILLREMLSAMEILRLKNQEKAALRNTNQSQAVYAAIETYAHNLLDRLYNLLGLSGIRLEIKPSMPHFAGLQLVLGEDAWLKSSQADAAMRDLLVEIRLDDCSPREIENASNFSAWLVPCCLPGNAVIGGMLLISRDNRDPKNLPPELLGLIAGQLAMLIESERAQQGREYRLVLQERIRLAREIHDSLAQTLAYLKLTVAQMQNQLAHGELQRLEQTIHQSYQAIADAYLETRQVIDSLRLNPGENIILWLEPLARDFEKVSGMRVERVFPTEVPNLEPEVQAQLLRIVQEALSNVRKHSQANHVRIEVRNWKDLLILEISDNGVGFTAEDVPEYSRHGLRGMRERAELIGADFQVISKPQEGTTIRINLPIKQEETPV